MTFEEKFPQLAEFVAQREQQEHDDEFAEGRSAVRCVRAISRTLSNSETKTKADMTSLIELISDLISEYEDGVE